MAPLLKIYHIFFWLYLSDKFQNKGKRQKRYRKKRKKIKLLEQELKKICQESSYEDDDSISYQFIPTNSCNSYDVAGANESYMAIDSGGSTACDAISTESECDEESDKNFLDDFIKSLNAEQLEKYTNRLKEEEKANSSGKFFFFFF